MLQNNNPKLVNRQVEQTTARQTDLLIIIIIIIIMITVMTILYDRN